MIVRYQTPLRRGLALAGTILGAILLIYGTYEWGRFDGGYSVFSMLQERREKAAEVRGLTDENTTLRAQVTSAETARSVEHKSYEDVERTLGELQSQVQRQREELQFYRGIVSPEDGVGGLRIQRLDVLPGAGDGHFKLRLVLMQSMRQDAVIAGSIKIELEGSRDKQPVRLTLAEIGGQTRESGDVAFSFRYFQNIEQDIALPENFEPTAIDVEVRSSRQQPLHQSFPWSVRASG
ncbi:MAG TPA: DUF6776 family protein [Steroidobacteraceae bacterium]|nr:DUF6776 family protein [Steroidobacteraceae bacterium]